MSDNTLLKIPASSTDGDTLRTLEDSGNIKYPVGVPGMVTSLGTPDVVSVPVAAALADNTTNPTAYLNGSCILVFDGSTWDRAPGTAADGLLVNLGSNNDVTVTGTVAVTQSGTWNIATVTTITAVTAITNALPAGTNNIGDVDVASIAAGDNNIGNVDIVTVPADPFGANADAASATGSISAKLRFIASTGIPITGTVTVGSHAVTNAGTFATQVTSIAAGENGIGRVKLTDGTDVADVLDLTNSNPLTVAIVDGSGDQITSFGGGTQYTEGDTDATITGTAVMWEDGSNTLRAASAAKPLPVEIIAGAGSGGTAAADDADFTAGTTNGTPAMGVFESSPTSVTDGDLGTVGITAARRLKTSTTIDAAIPAGTNNIGDVDVLTIAAGDNNIGNVDIVTVPSDPFGVNADAASATGSISAKLRFIAATGIPITGTVTVGSHAVTNAGTFVVQENGASLTALQIMDDWDNGASDGASVSGDVAHDTADAGEPVKVGAKAIASQHGLTLVAANDRTDLFAGLDGIQLTRPHTNLESIVSGNASNTDGASTEVLAAGAAGIKHYLTTIILTNTHASSNIYVEIKDGSTTKLTIPVPAGGGAVVNLPVPLGGTAATAWNFDPSAAIATIYASVIGFKSKI